jgi:hypothetical protein
MLRLFVFDGCRRVFPRSIGEAPNIGRPLFDSARVASSDSELRAAVEAQRVTGDPAGLVGGEKHDSGAYIVRLADTFQGLDAQREVATGIAPCEGGHVGVDHTWRDGIDADAAVAQGRSEVLHERIDGTLGGRIGGQRADSRMRR